jgi:uncharacterized membrane protein YjjB (DUF3815 family)
MKKFFVLCAALALVPALAAAQAMAPKLDGHPTAAEAAFVSTISTDLQARFPTTASAMRAHYIRFTDEDSTGAISYANRMWNSADPAHPSQLWYDANGHLIGADYSVLYVDSSNPPTLWGVDPSRWGKIGAHVHYGLVGPNGTTIYGGIGSKGLEAVGATVVTATAASLVAAGKAKKTSDVRFLFTFPAIWDLQVWLIPNPNGAFAEKNPNVTPTAGTKMQM